MGLSMIYGSLMPLSLILLRLLLHDPPAPIRVPPAPAVSPTPAQALFPSIGPSRACSVLFSAFLFRSVPIMRLCFFSPVVFTKTNRDPVVFSITFAQWQYKTCRC